MNIKIVNMKINSPRLAILDVVYTFKYGHRLINQIQSTWFSFVDRNTKGYVDNIFEARDDVFIKALYSVYRLKDNASHLKIGV